MHFCPTCGNLLMVEPDTDGMRFCCQTCPYIYKIENKVRVFSGWTRYSRAVFGEQVQKKVPLQRKQVDDVLGGDQAWENVDQTESLTSFVDLYLMSSSVARCPFCQHDKAYFMQIQIRSADEPSTTFYKCVACKKQWNDK
ncbi:DNA-directed RNA polymerase III subunit RPC10 [Aphanomyces cochlioides]|nr:DNA-directed RNA polymerase III subunit RPC10 [Aphanomyces cochlioides]